MPGQSLPGCGRSTPSRRAPLLGNTDPAGEILRAEQGKMERADAGTAVYTLRLQAEYTNYFEEEPNEN